MSALNPFLWRQYPRDSIFMEGNAFRVLTSGKSRSETCSDAASKQVARTIAETGVSPGTVHGISKASRAANKEKAWARPSGVR